MGFRSEGMSRASFESASPKLNEPLLMRRAEEEEEEEEEEEQFQFRSSCETQKSEGEGKRTEEEEAVQPPLLRNMASKEKGEREEKRFPVYLQFSRKKLGSHRDTVFLPPITFNFPSRKCSKRTA